MSPTDFFDKMAHGVMRNSTQNVIVGRDNNGIIAVGGCQDKLNDALLEISHLKSLIENKDKFLEEKERLINVLMNRS
ncbi:hypothetical protein JCM10512_460 [Bacteroides reticulotermitis JCM 10512]|uniref:Uncharacterized protein n=2 Tax=Bacteroides reticulotermitis TaxID=1133319 RepID=W4UNQ0_9BACE|nr:hypothetical protein JCM10512_460 [Bacteroides reticulotermitis JCM 10512]